MSKYWKEVDKGYYNKILVHYKGLYDELSLNNKNILIDGNFNRATYGDSILILIESIEGDLRSRDFTFTDIHVQYLKELFNDLKLEKDYQL